jgi:hypothetical protein
MTISHLSVELLAAKHVTAGNCGLSLTTITSPSVNKTCYFPCVVIDHAYDAFGLHHLFLCDFCCNEDMMEYYCFGCLLILLFSKPHCLLLLNCNLTWNAPSIDPSCSRECIAYSTSAKVILHRFFEFPKKVI